MDLPSGPPRWSRDGEPIEPYRTNFSLVLADDTLLFTTDTIPPRWVGYRLTDGQPLFDLDLPYQPQFDFELPYQPQVAHYRGGGLALTSDRMIMVYGDATTG